MCLSGTLHSIGTLVLMLFTYFIAVFVQEQMVNAAFSRRNQERRTPFRGFQPLLLKGMHTFLLSE
jgi:hypothetical protein